MSIRQPFLLFTAAAISVCCGCGNFGQNDNEVSTLSVLRELPPIPPTQSEEVMESLERGQPADSAQPAESKLSASHILIMHRSATGSGSGITRTKEEALKLAQEIAVKAKETGTNFANLAREYSEGPSSEKGGDLGVFLPGAMVKPFNNALLTLKIGEVSDPVETQYGFHIILRQQPYEEKQRRLPGQPKPR
ncbi:MAG: peptidyl-prolyl cis-trans isomerase [Fuerstiella sp.]|nr:peptidyl-prolyl cis-trans isomerase [Fuerstiella sp.]